MKMPIDLWAVPAFQTKENEGDLCVFPWFWHSKQEHMCSRNTVNKQCSSIPQDARCDMQIANMLTSPTECYNESTTESFLNLNKTLPLSQSSYIDPCKNVMSGTALQRQNAGNPIRWNRKNSLIFHLFNFFDF